MPSSRRRAVRHVSYKDRGTVRDVQRQHRSEAMLLLGKDTSALAVALVTVHDGPHDCSRRRVPNGGKAMDFCNIVLVQYETDRRASLWLQGFVWFPPCPTGEKDARTDIETRVDPAFDRVGLSLLGTTLDGRSWSASKCELETVVLSIGRRTANVMLALRWKNKHWRPNTCSSS
ncbi:hypothetical protein GY45DRAFT_1320250 [Cubamyces sp. BRFM 1775]|nr:hypothetical protein GY45DRAFT_1320250 [Cubamyces sp. BRFM 1775]